MIIHGILHAGQTEVFQKNLFGHFFAFTIVGRIDGFDSADTIAGPTELANNFFIDYIFLIYHTTHITAKATAIIFQSIHSDLGHSHFAFKRFGSSLVVDVTSHAVQLLGSFGSTYKSLTINFVVYFESL